MISKLLLCLACLSVFCTLVLATLKNFFSYMFVLVYMGAILVLIVYMFSSQVSFKSFSFSYFFFFLLGGVIVFLFFLLNSKKVFLESEFKFFLYKKKELFFVVFLCMKILLVLFCMLNLDLFRFSSLRTKV